MACRRALSLNSASDRPNSSTELEPIWPCILVPDYSTSGTGQIGTRCGCGIEPRPTALCGGHHSGAPPRVVRQQRIKFSPFHTLHPIDFKLHLCFLSQEYPPSLSTALVGSFSRWPRAWLRRGTSSASSPTAKVTIESILKMECGSIAWFRLTTPSPRRWTFLRTFGTTPRPFWVNCIASMTFAQSISSSLQIGIPRVSPPCWMAHLPWSSVSTLPCGPSSSLIPQCQKVEKGGDLVPRRIQLEDFIYRHADGYLACGPAVVAEIEGEYDVTLRSDRLGLVPHGLPDISIECPEFTNRAAFEFCSVGRLESRKGIDTLLEAVPLLAARGRISSSSSSETTRSLVRMERLSRVVRSLVAQPPEVRLLPGPR